MQAIRAEGKEMELALGLTKMSTTDMYASFCLVTFNVRCAFLLCSHILDIIFKCLFVVGLPKLTFSICIIYVFHAYADGKRTKA